MLIKVEANVQAANTLNSFFSLLQLPGFRLRKSFALLKRLTPGSDYFAQDKIWKDFPKPFVQFTLIELTAIKLKNIPISS